MKDAQTFSPGFDQLSTTCVLLGHMPYTTALSQLEDMRQERSSQSGAIPGSLVGR